MIDKRTKELLKILLHVTSKKNIQVAIGGGIAVNIYNVPRFTSDIDAYFKRDDRIETLKYLRQAGFEVCKVGSPHYSAFLVKYHRNVKIRTFFPKDKPEISAIDKPIMVNKWGMNIPVFPVELLVLAKFYSNRTLDKWDIAALYMNGSFEPETVKQLLSNIDPEQIGEFDELINDIRSETGKPRKRPPKR